MFDGGEFLDQLRGALRENIPQAAVREVWAPGMSIDPHDHRTWAVIGIYGGDFFATPRSEWDPETQEERPSSSERSRELFQRFGGGITTEVE
jgi:hypothetical protein